MKLHIHPNSRPSSTRWTGLSVRMYAGDGQWLRGSPSNKRKLKETKIFLFGCVRCFFAIYFIRNQKEWVALQGTRGHSVVGVIFATPSAAVGCSNPHEEPLKH